MAFYGAIYQLTKWGNWEKSYEPGDRRAVEAAAYWRDLLYEYLKVSECEDFECPEGCVTLPLNDPRIEWYPNDPFRTPNLVPGGYLFPPWYIAPTVNVWGLSEGDISTDFLRITAIAGWWTQYPLPRFRINVTGPGIVKMHFVSTFQGGYAQIQVDGELTSLRYVDLHRDIGVPGETNDVIIVEREFTDSLPHFIDVSAFPQVGEGEIPVGFGMGVRKIELCGFTSPCPECPDCPCEDCDDDCGDCEACDDDCEECE